MRSGFAMCVYFPTAARVPVFRVGIWQVVWRRATGSTPNRRRIDLVRLEK